jgi:acetyl esterase
MPKLTPRERLEVRAARALSALPPRAQVRLSGKPAVRIDGQVLDPEIQMTLALLERRGDPTVETLAPEEGRRVTRRQAEVFSGPPIPMRDVRDLTVSGAEGPLPARHYVPEEPGAGPHPLLVFLHGGGFVIGDLETHDATCRLLARHSGAHVLAIDYRLAPEHPFPAPVEDAVAAVRWALANAAALGADPERVAVGGDSAGGNLAAVSCLELAREDGPRPAAQLLLYPTVEAGRQGGSLDDFAEGFFLTKAQMEWFAAQYVPAGTDPDDPRLSPLKAPDLSGLPPALVLTAGFDPLRDEGEDYAHALRAAGVPVLLRRFPGLVHGFGNMTSVSRTSREALIEIAGAMRAVLATIGPAHALDQLVEEPAEA